MIIHVFGKVQGPTSTGYLHDEYLKNILKVPISLKITNSTWFYIVNADFQVLSEFKVPVT